MVRLRRKEMTSEPIPKKTSDADIPNSEVNEEHEKPTFLQDMEIIESICIAPIESVLNIDEECSLSANPTPEPSDSLNLVDRAMSVLKQMPLDTPERGKTFAKIVAALWGCANPSREDEEHNFDFPRELALLMQSIETVAIRSTTRERMQLAEILKEIGSSILKAEEALRAKKAV